MTVAERGGWANANVLLRTNTAFLPANDEAAAALLDNVLEAAPGPPQARQEVKVREVIWLLEQDGWLLDRQKGSHRQYGHAAKPGTVTVAGNLGAQLKPGTLASVLRPAGLKGPSA